ncbi:unnamed protein product [Brachionus calyciflorus]|uniref:Uncharacterized protein n=1 Tax=Brachionus calyciflorus TaxID=104777 RepID=A0A814CU48_9BILA|nr:unnamed protein product [Brachionus calyciflorus]
MSKKTDKNFSTKSEALQENIIKNVVRGPLYLCASLILLFSTILILIAMFTSNWQRKTSIINSQEYFTYGLWFTCRHISLKWIQNHHDYYCTTSNYSLFTWIHASQVFYTVSVAMNLFILLIALIGVCKDFGRNSLGMPSLIFWLLVISSLFQLIAISVYGGKGIADYTEYQADYSIIIASVGLGVNALSALLFLIEILTFKKITTRI